MKSKAILFHSESDIKAKNFVMSLPCYVLKCTSIAHDSDSHVQLTPRKDSNKFSSEQVSLTPGYDIRQPKLYPFSRVGL